MKMRSEKEIFDLILGIANTDQRIRAVTMNGSRAVKNTKRDCFQDYDIVYIVTDVSAFAKDKSWIDVFGDRMIMQLPEDWYSHPYDYDSNKPFVYLMQFMDGTRLDLCLCTIDDFKDEGEPTVVLLDKDGILPAFAESSGECYFIKAPGKKEFADCCNEFWWLCPYVAKELWREGLPYAKVVLEQHIHEELMKMLNWHIGLQLDYSVSTGKKSKYIKQYLSASDYATLESTYPNLSEESIWEALFTMCTLFHEKAELVAKHFGYEYPIQEVERIISFLRHIKQLPKSAETIY